jgi:tRNA (cmo5U34)-methyltransferase
MTTKNFFGEDHAKVYDKKNEKLGPIRDSLLNVAKASFSRAPEDAQILCVGAGTGDEIINLAVSSQHWHFTVVEPSEPMMEICKKKLKELGLDARCTFHAGYIDSLNSNVKYDAATCILVGHFVLDRNDRVDLYHQIASRLKQGGYLLNADLSIDKSSPQYEHIMSLWETMWWSSQITDNQMLSKMRENFERNVSLVPPKEIENMLVEAGYTRTSPVFQSLLIHGWVSPKA